MATTAAPRRREATRERLLEAARHVLAETGIQGATVETICERAGFTRGAFYSNFASKDDLVVALFRREGDLISERMQEAVDAEVSAGDDPSGAAVRVVERFLATYPHDRENFLIHQEFVTHSVRHPKIAGVYRDLSQRTTDDLTQIITSAATTLGLTLRTTPRTVAQLLLGAFEIALRTHFLESADTRFEGQHLQPLVEALLSTVVDDA